MPIVENLKKQPLEFRTVWRTPTGEAPEIPADATREQLRALQRVERYQLQLWGSDYTDDMIDAHNAAVEEGKPLRPYNSVDVPQWALDRYRGEDDAVGCPIFKNREADRIIRVHNPA